MIKTNSKFFARGMVTKTSQYTFFVAKMYGKHFTFVLCVEGFREPLNWSVILLTYSGHFYV